MSYQSKETHKAVQETLDSVTSDANTGIAGLVFAAINKDGEMITANASGNRGLDTKEPMTLETTFWIASCTKMVAAIAVMQLVEQGKLDLDDHQQLYKLCPELEKVKVLGDDGKLHDKEKEITIRMLLSHVSTPSII
jgi:CubicO group peptidase (beta-lactamase class C family)